jgi:hypothetical protein
MSGHVDEIYSAHSTTERLPKVKVLRMLYSVRSGPGGACNVDKPADTPEFSSVSYRWVRGKSAPRI